MNESESVSEMMPRTGKRENPLKYERRILFNLQGRLLIE